MSKILIVALREFRSTVLTRAFLLGLLLPPVLMALGIGASILFSTDRAPAIAGSVALIDRSAGPNAEGFAIKGIQQRMSPDEIGKAAASEAGEAIKAVAKDAAANPGASAVPNPAGQAKAVEAGMNATARPPELTLETLAATASAEAEKDALTNWSVEKGGRLALIVIEPSVIKPPADSAGDSYTIYIAPKLDPRVTSLIRRQVSDAVVEARLTQAGLDPKRIDQLTQLPRPTTTEVTKDGQRSSTGGFQFIIPFAFFMLLWISAFSGAGQLLNNTIEEKSNRIMEVLLSAVSPFQLMAGKILGQMCAGFIIVAVYAGAGLIALIGFSLADLVQPWQIAWLLVFYVLAYLFIASVFAAIGSAVSDIQEANSLMTPAMLLIMIPMFTVFPIIQNPTGMLAQVLSYLPPFSPFAMIARVSSNQPPAQWQIVLSALVSALGAIAAVWAASKVFRIGVLLYGKPPSIPTLIKWIRMA